jgi:membrane protein implicated in regulation of membrane protease activity
MLNRMSKRMVIAAVIYMMVQAVVFGIGVVLVLATPLANIAMTLMPFVVALTLVISAPISWWLAPLARAAHERKLNAQEPGRSTDDQPDHGYHWSR